MTVAWGVKIVNGCVACVCLTFGTIFLVIALFMSIGLLMGVMAKSFALPIDLYKSLSNSRNSLFTEIFFKRYKITSVITMTV